MHDIVKPHKHNEYTQDKFPEYKVGQSASFAKIITDADLILFAGLSGDTNPLHFDESFAKTTFFQGRITHGLLTAALISTVLGTKLPGPGCVYLSQNLKFIAPVKLGETVEARATIAEIISDKRRLLLKTECFVGDRVVIEGDAVIWVPKPKA
ncbi:MAG: MaoC family dehydratase [Alphaproteobacteria bacterium]